MKVAVLATALFYICACLAPACCAAETAEGQPRDPEPDAKEGKPEELSVWEGFRGVKWGANIKELSGFVEFEADADTQICFRKDDALTIGAATLNSIVYVFYKDALSGVMITAKGNQNFEALKDAMVARYGTPTQDNPFIDNYVWVHARGRPDAVYITLELEMFSEKVTVVYGHGSFINQLAEQGKKAAQKGAKEDF